MIYVAFIHRDEAPGYGISFPDFPGCVSHGDSIENAIRLGREALGFHAEGLLADGMALPRPEASMRSWRTAIWQSGARVPRSPMCR
ncbi:MAG: type II toxin-antitoxin system HicB family antitoxin [Rhodobacteraceae bacterium]|nr:type II toxin-antitoxin system HicB family antitoxin [Paracoccaceae bacterium]